LTAVSPDGTDLDEDLIRMLLARTEGQPARLWPDRRYRKAAVLLPLVYEQSIWKLLFIRRTETVFDHKGQVAFPGGAVEPEDRSMVDTALREAYEEIGLPPTIVRVLGRLPDYATITDFLITPIVAKIQAPFPIALSENEVARVFTIPLTWLMEPSHSESRPRTLPDGRNENVIYFHSYDGELLWGVTARIVCKFLTILKSE
jgi:8-oxo-dGTP pyrophosphatase MutT (NUDIX family)